MTDIQTITQLGYSIVPTGPDKWPTVQWKQYQSRIPSQEEIASWPQSYGWAAVCGAVSGNLEVIDFDLKNDLTGTLFDDFMQMVIDLMPEIAGSLVVAQSRSKGRHIFYKSTVIQGNQKLASRPADEAELNHNPNLKLYGLIETRGEGGIIVIHPTPGYTWLQGDLSSVPVIKPEQRDELLNIARSFNSYISPPDIHYQAPPPQESGYSLTPWADYNQRGDILSVLQKHGYTILKQQGDNIRLRRPGKSLSISGDFNVVKRWFTLFTTSTQFDSQKAYTPAAVLCKLEHGDDWTALYHRLVADGFGVKLPEIPSQVIKAMNKGEATQEEIETYKDKYDQARGPSILKFWYTVVDKAGNITVEIDRIRLKAFLKEMGFFLYYHDEESPAYDIVRVNNRTVWYASDTDMIQEVIKYVNTLPNRFDGIHRDDLLRKISERLHLIHDVKNIKFNLEKLHDQGWKFLRDTRDTCFLPFQNGIVQVSASGAVLLPYSEVDKLIWNQTMIRRNVEFIDDFSGSQYCRFVRLISKDIDPSLWDQRERSAHSILGYLIHGYKDRIRPKAIILMEQCEDPIDGGGTGKGLFIQGISALVKTVLKIGKSFDPNSTFAFQDITPYTRVLNVSDPGRKFRIEDYNSIITDAIKTERKNRDSITLLYEDSPKLVIDMNYTITEIEESALRRIETFEFSNYFSIRHTPADEFDGQALFHDWSDEEYNRYYNFMFYCIQSYLANGFYRVPISETGKIKTMKQRWGEGFSDWFREWIKSPESKQPTKSGILYDRFIEDYHDSKPYSRESFGRGLIFCAKLYGLKLNEKRLSEPKRPKAYWIGEEKKEEDVPF